MIRLAVLIQSTRVTDAQTNKQTDGRNCSSIRAVAVLSRVKMRDELPVY